MAERRPPSTVLNIQMDEAVAKMDREKVDRLVVNEIVQGKQFTLLEIERNVGPLAADNQNNVLC